MAALSLKPNVSCIKPDTAQVQASARARLSYIAQAIVVGSDIPDLSGDLLGAAAAALDQHEARPSHPQPVWTVQRHCRPNMTSTGSAAAQVVLGPAHDGGFYLIGATRTPPAMLEARPGYGSPCCLPQSAADGQACAASAPACAVGHLSEQTSRFTCA